MKHLSGLSYNGQSMADWSGRMKKRKCTLCGEWANEFFEIDRESVCLCQQCRDSLAECPGYEWLRKEA